MANMIAIQEDECRSLLSGTLIGKKPVYGIFDGYYKVLFSSVINILLLFVPIGLLCRMYLVNVTLTFICNVLATIPLAFILGATTEQIANRTSNMASALINCTLGNCIELLIAIFSLNKGMLRIVQSAMVGSILCNLLLVLGTAFLFSGVSRKVQKFSLDSARPICAMMTMSILVFIIPAAFVAATQDARPEDGLLTLSEMISVLLLINYILILVFQFKTHKELFGNTQLLTDIPDYEVGLGSSLSLLLATTVCSAYISESLVDCLEEFSKVWYLSHEMLGLIILPIVTNFPELFTAASVSYKGNIDLALSVAVGSSMQIALFATPILVIVGRILKQELTLYFNVFETAMLLITVLLLNFTVNSGRATWIEGTMLISSFIAMAIGFSCLTSNPLAE